MKRILLISLMLVLAPGAFAQKKDDSVSREGQQKAEDMPAPKAESKPPPDAKKLTPSFKAEVKKLMDATNVKANQESLLEKMAEDLSKDAKDPSKAKKSTLNFFKDTLSADALSDDMAQAYSYHFSEAEIKKLVAFYQSPIGKKAVEKMPVVNQDMMMVGQMKLQRRMKEFKEQKDKLEGFK